MLALNDTMEQLAMANRVRWYGYVLRREDGHVSKRALDVEVEGQWEKERPKTTWKNVLDKIKKTKKTKFDSSFTAWTVLSPTIAHVSNLSPTQSLRSLVHRKLSHGNESAALCVIASDDTFVLRQ